MRKTLLAFILIAALIFTNSIVFAAGTKAPGAANGTKFTDVSGHWAEDAINRIAGIDTFGGKESKFQPNKAITRSEFVLMLHKALNIRVAYLVATDIKEFYDDVKNEDIYAGALYDLTVLNIIDGKGKFNPGSKLTREDMVHYIMNAYRYKMADKYKAIKISVNPFADDKKINPSYSGDIYRAENMGLIKRPASNMFYPKHEATRAQAAVITDRLLKRLENETAQVTVTPGVEQKDGLLRMKLTITNNKDTQIVINHSSGQKYDFSLLDSGRNIIYTWSADKMFTMIVGETVIGPGQSVEFSGEVEKALLDGLSKKPAYMKAYLVGDSTDFEINRSGYEAEIK